jgi:translocation and assembly module TamB
MGKPRLRKFLLGALILLCLVVVLIAALPLWLPLILRPALDRFGVQYGEYERRGYNRLVLNDVVYQDERIRFQAEELETLAPLSLLWRHYAGREAAGDYVRASNWRLDFLEEPERPPGPGIPLPPGAQVDETQFSLYAILEQTEEAITTLQEWIPNASMTNGLVRFQAQDFRVPSMHLREHRLNARVLAAEAGQQAEVDASVPPGKPWHINITVQPLGIETRLTIRREKGVAQVEGVGVWEGNEIHFSGLFPEGATLPSQARLEADPLVVPPEVHQIEGYQELAGSLQLRWTGERFDLKAQARAEPVPDLPLARVPIQAVVSAGGTTNRVQLQQVELTAPFLDLHLVSPAELDFTGQLLSEEALVELRGDLGQQPWVELQGLFQGGLRLLPGPERFPLVQFQLEGHEVAGYEVATDQLRLRGELQWPEATLEEALLTFPDGSLARAQGTAILEEERAANLTFEAEGPFANSFLPAGYSYHQLRIIGQVSGPITNLAHSGQAEIAGIQAPDFHEVQLLVDWAGQNFSLDPLRLQASAGSSLLELELSGRGVPDQIEGVIRQFRFTQGEEQIWELANPARLSFIRPAPIGQEDQPAMFILQLEPFQLRGTSELALEANLEWPLRGSLRAEARQLFPQLFQDFLEKEFPRVTIGALAFNARWDEEPVEFLLELDGSYSTGHGAPLDLAARVEGDFSGMVIEQLEVSSEGHGILQGEGVLPVTLEPGHPDNPFQLHMELPMVIHAATFPQSPVWAAIAAETGVRLEDPHVRVSVSGTIASPQGTVQLEVARLDPAERFPELELPELRRLSAAVRLGENRIRLSHFELFIQEHPVQATAEVPFDLRRMEGDALLDLDQLEARLILPETPIAPFISFLPAQVSPQGAVSADVSVLPGWQLDGEVIVRDAATRPILPLGPVQDIAARIGFENQIIQVQQLSGLVGGETAIISGTVDLGQIRPITGLPFIHLKVNGENLPLSRQPDLILRSDLDLLISNAEDSPPVISGTVNLRDSFYFSDLRILLPGQLAQPARRPPYFRITAPPIAEWTLDLDVGGTEFLTVRSPFFRGVVSAHLRLERSLNDPILLGEVIVPRGLIRFPFGNLEVMQGLVSFTIEDPYRPQIFLTAGARNFGYDLQMEVSGSLEDPVIELQSTPGLTSEEIILMLTTGSLPRQDFRFTNEQRAARLAFFLGRNLLAQLGMGESATDRLVFRSGEHISEQGRETYYLEYRLSEDWSLVGEYDRFNAFNAGVKWRFYSR